MSWTSKYACGGTLIATSDIRQAALPSGDVVAARGRNLLQALGSGKGTTRVLRHTQAQVREPQAQLRCRAGVHRGSLHDAVCCTQCWVRALVRRTASPECIPMEAPLPEATSQQGSVGQGGMRTAHQHHARRLVQVHHAVNEGFAAAHGTCIVCKQVSQACRTRLAAHLNKGVVYRTSTSVQLQHLPRCRRCRWCIS
jgi:hypothetical protein